MSRRSVEPLDRDERGLDGVVLALDVGGTWTRISAAPVVRGRLAAKPRIVARRERSLSSKKELAGLIREVSGELGVPVLRAALAFAGPRLAAGKVRMTNWPGKPTIRLEEASRLGLPPGRTLFFNDMELAARGLLGQLRRDGTPAGAGRTLYSPPGPKAGDPGEGNRVLLIPGTGLGTIGMVAAATDAGESGEREPVADEPSFVPSEVQHAGASPLDDGHLALIRWLRERRGSSGWPAWEDFVSGYGLVQVYDGLSALRGRPPLPAAVRASDPGAWIADRARRGRDPVAVEALGLYYRCAARVGQLLALAYQPRGGIFLAGTSTRANLRFIERSAFLAELHANPSQRELLRQFPVYLVTEELNLAGALRACRESLAA